MLSFQKLKEIPSSFNPGAIDRAIKAFVDNRHVTYEGDNKDGFKQQLTDVIASILIFKTNQTAFFWASEYDGELVCFALTHVSKDVDNSLSYWMTDAWVAPQLRHTDLPKQWFNTMREDAKHLMCKHVLIPSSRGSKAYCRWLGKGWKKHLEIIKEDI